jgi:2',3'-cyclic-nucleotide 2'-phosphodiesterase/3'-nucleotidase
MTGLFALLAASVAATTSVDLTILGTTDIHGRIYPTSYYKPGLDEPVGLARIATLVRRERAAHPNVLLVDSGDLLQGSPLTDWFTSLPEAKRGINPLIATLNAMRYDAWSVGNHDFDYGMGILEKARKDAKFPFLSANAYLPGTQRPVFEAFSLHRIGEVQVAFIGATPPGVALWNKRHVDGRVDFGDITAAFARTAAQAKASGADIVIGIPHAGYGGDGPFGPRYSGYSASSGLPPEQVGFALAETVKDVDALLLGHSHQTAWSEPATGVTYLHGTHNGKPVSIPVTRPIPIVQAGHWGRSLAALRLKLAHQDGRWRITSWKTELISAKDVPPDPDILALTRESHDATVAYVNATVATTSDAWDARLSRFMDTPIVDLINAAQRERTGADLSAAACFNPDAGLARGPISMAQIAAIYPYDNALLAVRITGRQLRAYLERSARYYAIFAPGNEAADREWAGFNYDMISGVDYALNITKPPGSRVVGLTYRGKPVSDGDSFTLALNSYRQQGGGGFEEFRDAPVVYNRDENIRDVLIDFLKHKGAIRPADVFEANWRLLPEGAVDPETRRYRDLTLK